ncbi:hypothetical protein ANCCAN_18007, partial [Ancylostoma caninum]
VRNEPDVNATVDRPCARKGRNCGSGIKKKNTVDVEERRSVEAAHVLPRRTPLENENLSRLSRKSAEASSVLPKRTPLPFQYRDVAGKPTEPMVSVGRAHKSSKSTAGTTHASESRDAEKETQYRKRKRPLNCSSCEDSTKRILRPVLPRMAKKVR